MQYEILVLQYEIALLKQKRDLLQSCKNRREKPNMEKVEEQVEQTAKTYNERIYQEEEKIKHSPELLEMMGSKLPNSLQPFSREIFLLDIVVAGTSYCKRIDEIYPKLEKGLVLRMLRHPSVSSAICSLVNSGICVIANLLGHAR